MNIQNQDSPIRGFQFDRLAETLSVHRCKTILDIGAWVGEWADRLKPMLPKDSEIISIECNPLCESHLKARGHKYYIAALSDLPKDLKFYINKDDAICSGFSYYIEDSHHYNKKLYTELSSTTLDILCQSENLSPNAIKLDTQGSEHDILLGAKKILNNKDLKVICLESAKQGVPTRNPGASSQIEIIKYLDEFGFSKIEKIGGNFLRFDQPDEMEHQQDLMFTRA
jgi:FkbM family methyltransferase